MSIYHNQIINSNNKMKTTWDIIKSVSVRQNEHKTSKYQNSNKSFTNIKFNNPSIREITRIMKSLKLKIHLAMMKSLQKY